jgi:hypothetical protein
MPPPCLKSPPPVTTLPGIVLFSMLSVVPVWYAPPPWLNASPVVVELPEMVLLSIVSVDPRRCRR